MHTEPRPRGFFCLQVDCRGPVIVDVIRLKFYPLINPACDRAKLILFQGAICRRPTYSRPGSFTSAITTLRNCICNLCGARSCVLFCDGRMDECILSGETPCVPRITRTCRWSLHCAPLRGPWHCRISYSCRCCCDAPKSRWIRSVPVRSCYLCSVRLLSRVHGLACHPVRSRDCYRYTIS